MGQTSFDAQKISDSATGKDTAVNGAIKQFLEEHYGKGNKAAAAKDSAGGATGDHLQKQHEKVDLNKLFELNPLYSGQDDKYIEKQWKNSAVDAPTDKEQSAASAKMKDTVNPLLNDSDKEALSKAQDAILKGEPKDLADALGQYKNNPAKLKAFIDELNKNFEKNNVHLGLKTEGDTVSLNAMTGGGESEVDFNMRTGKLSASFGTLGRASFDGTISKDPEVVMKRMGNIAVGEINKASN